MLIDIQGEQAFQADRATTSNGLGILLRNLRQQARLGQRRDRLSGEVTSDLCGERALMQGGTCEATAYALYGYRAAALCVALGNYHNCGPRDTIAPEFVSLSDAVGMADLCVAAARTRASDPLKALRRRLEERMKGYRKFF